MSLLCLRQRRVVTRPAVIVATVTVAAGCQHESPTAAATEPARLQVINAARAPIDVLVDGTVRVSALAAASVSPVLAVGEGARRIEVRASGASGTVAMQLTAHAASVALVAAQVGSTGTLAASVLADTAAIPAPGTSKLRILHMAGNAAPTRIWVLFPSQASKAADPTAYGNGGPWFYGGSTPFYQDTPGSWDVVITPVTFAPGASAPPPTDSASASHGSAGGSTTGTGAAGASRDPHAYAIARLVVPVAADQARTVVMLDGPDGGVRVVATGAP